VTALFLDTSFILALEDADDQYHREAAACWHTFHSHPQPLVTTAYVFDEAMTLIRKRLDHARAMVVAKRLRTSPLVTLVHVDQADFEASLTWFERYHDKDFSFTDCVSFAVMKRLNIKTALTFDQHFVQAGFERKP
jgi:predicted nucleic acid-binding protein